MGNFSEQYQSLRESLESNEPGGRHFGLDPVIENARGFVGPGREEDGPGVQGDINAAATLTPETANYGDDLVNVTGTARNVDAVLGSAAGGPRVHVGGGAPDASALGGLPQSEDTTEPTQTLRLDDGGSERGEIGGLRSISGQTVAFNSLELGGHVTPREPELAQPEDTPAPSGPATWRGHSVVFINNEPVEVQDLINQAKRDLRDPVGGSGATTNLGRAFQGIDQRFNEAITQKATAAVTQYLDRGAESGGVRTESYTPPSRTLTYQDFEDGYTTTTGEQKGNPFNLNPVPPGPRQAQLQRHRDEYNQNLLQDLQGEFSAGRVSFPGDENPVRYYPPLNVAYTSSELVGDVVGPVGFAQAFHESKSPHSPDGAMTSTSERSHLSHEAMFAVADLTPIPAGQVAGAAGNVARRTFGTLTDVGGNIIDTTSSAYRRQGATVALQNRGLPETAINRLTDPNTPREVVFEVAERHGLSVQDLNRLGLHRDVGPLADVSSPPALEGTSFAPQVYTRHGKVNGNSRTACCGAGRGHWSAVAGPYCVQRGGVGGRFPTGWQTESAIPELAPRANFLTRLFGRHFREPYIVSDYNPALLTRET